MKWRGCRQFIIYWIFIYYSTKKFPTCYSFKENFEDKNMKISNYDVKRLVTLSNYAYVAESDCNVSWLNVHMNVL